jgi:hypothetical protein
MTDSNKLKSLIRSDSATCTHPVTEDYEVAGLRRSRCRQCDWVSIAFVDDGRGGALFSVPRNADR